jgi:hypothetical protein
MRQSVKENQLAEIGINGDEHAFLISSPLQ